MSARKIFYDRQDSPDGSILEMTIWEVPTPVPGSSHRLNYSLFYGARNVRWVGYDNERGKGDHRHYGDREEPYLFASPEALIRDFLKDVRRMRGEE